MNARDQASRVRLTWPRRAARLDTTFEGVLGTTLHLRVLAASDRRARAAQSAALAEIDRLEGVFSRHRQDSELVVWARSGEARRVSPELAVVLGEALRWWRRSNGAFHPAAGRLGTLWRAAAASGELPPQGHLAQVVTGLKAVPFELSGRTARSATPDGPDLNAIAKGFIVDRAAQAARAVPGVSSVLVNIGGDLRHLGAGHVRAAVADPFARADNAPPLSVVRLGNAALATSGHTHRGFTVAGRWYSHVLDPRTGRPVQDVVSTSVLAPDALTADVLATVLGVLPPHEGLALAEQEGVGLLLAMADHTLHASAAWTRAELHRKEIP